MPENAPNTTTIITTNTTNTTNTTTPTIHIIIPYYNTPLADRTPVLTRAVQSVINQVNPQQSFQWHLWLVNDGSTVAPKNAIHTMNAMDKVPPMDTSLSKWIQTYPNIHYLELPQNVGVAAARNAGVQQALQSECTQLPNAPHSTYIAFLDSDDEWHPSKLQEQLHFLQNSPYQICQTQEVWVRNGIRVNAPKHLCKIQGDLFAASLLHCMITPSSVLLTANLWQEYKGFDPDFLACEDYELWLRISAKYPIGLLDKPLMTRYGGHADQLSAKYPVMDIFRIKALHKVLQSNTLNPNQRQQAQAVLAKKVKIVANGARKRNNTDVLLQLQTLGLVI